MQKTSIGLVLLLAVAHVAVAADQSGETQSCETRQQRDTRMAWWRDAKFGMFIHWGIYSVPAQGEWHMFEAKVPVAEYAKHAAVFNPTKFDATKIVATAKSAGMKYIVITAKHHDGFSMFATKASDFNIADATPLKRDVIREMSNACHEAGLKFGIYYSIGLDWHHPGGGMACGPKFDTAQKGDPELFLSKIVVPQIHELLNNYAVDLVWWDGGTPDVWDTTLPAHAARLYQEFKPFPHLIINNRLYDNYRGKQLNSDYWKPTDSLEHFIRGDYATPEGNIPASVAAGIDWETCESINNSWGFNKSEQHWKTSENLIRNLCDIASKGGNYLLNVGPTSEGLIPQPGIERLAEVGAWMNVNGDAIYGTSASPLKQPPWGRYSKKVSGGKT